MSFGSHWALGSVQKNGKQLVKGWVLIHFGWFATLFPSQESEIQRKV